MLIETVTQVTESSTPPTAPEDLTGRDRMVSNVLAGWAGQLVFIVSGFIMPRMTDRYLGQEALGVWDLGWSLIGCFGLVQCGIATSVNRYVAKYRSVGDVAALNGAVSSVSCVLLLMAVVVVGLTIASALLVPHVFAGRLGAHAGDAQWVVLLLGLSLAAQTAFAEYGGVVTGCHRWDLHNAIYVGGHVASVLGMVGVLLLGGGLSGLALACLCGEGGATAARYVVARRVCPDLRVRPSLARWSTAVEMLTYGSKWFVPLVGSLLLNQTVRVLIASFLGPPTLAVYSRPASLVCYAATFVNRLAFVMAPTASSLQATGDRAAIRGLLVSSTRYATALALPAVVLMAVMGGPVLRLWMGERYEQGLVLAVLAVGSLLTIVFQPALNILAGMDAHGRPGLVQFGAGVCTAGLALVVLGAFDWGLVGVAAASTVPLSLALGVYLPVYVCRCVEMSVREYLYEALRTPVLCAIPFALVLAGARALFAENPLVALFGGVATGGLVLAVLYWRFLVPDAAKAHLTA
jgi:O-antigen/teichoic acid export membrane protein